MGDVNTSRKRNAGESTRRIALIAVCGVAVFISKVFLPTPLDKMTVAVQALFLTLGSLLSKRLGATSVAAVGAALTVLLRPSFAPLTMAFALTYGLLTDGFIFVFRVRYLGGEVRARRLAAAVTLSTTVTGLASYFVTTHILVLLPRNPTLEILILVTGAASGLFGGFLAALVWKRALRHMTDLRASEKATEPRK